jgi:hypothetical protein
VQEIYNTSTGPLAEKMRKRCLDVMSETGTAEIIVPGKELTDDGLVSSIEDGKKAADLFLHENIDALIIGNMNFGHEVAVGEALSYMRRNLPILHFCTRSGPITGEGNRSTDNWCGQFMTVSSIKRRGFTYTHILTCNPEEERFKTGYANFVRAIYTLKSPPGRDTYQGRADRRLRVGPDNIFRTASLCKNIRS